MDTACSVAVKRFIHSVATARSGASDDPLEVVRKEYNQLVAYPKFHTKHTGHHLSTFSYHLQGLIWHGYGLD